MPPVKGLIVYLYFLAGLHNSGTLVQHVLDLSEFAEYLLRCIDFLSHLVPFLGVTV